MARDVVSGLCGREFDCLITIWTVDKTIIFFFCCNGEKCLFACVMDCQIIPDFRSNEKAIGLNWALNWIR